METFQKFGIALLILGLGLMGCDSGNDVGTVRLEGRVTDAQGYGKTEGVSKQETPLLQTAIEGAVVTAARIQGNGTLQPLGGQAQTDATGAFSLNVAARSGDLLMLRAEKGSFRSAVLVYVHAGSGGTVRTMPMTAESKAEAEVYVAVRNQDDNDQEDAGDASPALVAAYITASLAAELQAGGLTTAQLATSLQQIARAEAAFVSQAGVSTQALTQARQRQLAAWTALQADLHAATSAQAESNAIANFEASFLEAYTEAGLSAEARAKLLQTARLAATRLMAAGSPTARFALRKQAEILSALATTAAIEGSFRAAGVAQSRIDSLVQARAALLASLHAAATTTAIEQARAEYAAVAEAALRATLNMSSQALANLKASLSAARNALQTALSLAGSATAVAEASLAFYGSAESTISNSLQGNARAGLAATVLALLQFG
jgi:hypothetical protein